MKKRWPWSFKALAENLDLVLALMGALAAGGSFLAILLLKQSVPALARFAERPFPSIQIAALLILPFLAYAVIRWRYLGRGQSPWENPVVSRNVYLLLNIAFFAFFSYSVLSIAFRPDPYARPLGYFVATAATLGLLAVETFFLPRRGTGHSAFLLCKMLAVLLGLRLIPQLLSPTVIGLDPWGNQKLITSIVTLGHIPTGDPYSQLPGLPLGIATTSLAAGLDYRLSAMMFMIVLQAGSLVFAFLLVRHILNEKAGLLAVLFLGMAEGYLRMGVWIIAMGVAMALWYPVIYLLFKARERHSVPLTALYLLLMGLLVLTHPFAAMIMALTLILLWLGFLIHRGLYGGKAEVSTGINVVLFFSVVMLAWWAYASRELETLARLIKWGFTFESLPAQRPIEEVSKYLATVPVIENSLNRLGSDLLTAVTIIGSLLFVSRKLGSRLAFSIALIAPVLFFISQFSSPLGKSGLMPERWLYFFQAIEPIGAAAGVAVLVMVLKSPWLKAAAAFAVTGVTGFLLITSPVTDYDHAVYSSHTTVRYFLTASEHQSLTTLGPLWDGVIATDPTLEYPVVQEAGKKVQFITEELAARDFSDLQNPGPSGTPLVFIRKELLGHPFFAYFGVMRINYDPREALQEQGFHRVYDSGGMSAFTAP